MIWVYRGRNCFHFPVSVSRYTPNAPFTCIVTWTSTTPLNTRQFPTLNRTFLTIYPILLHYTAYPFSIPNTNSPHPVPFSIRNTDSPHQVPLLHTEVTISSPIQYTELPVTILRARHDSESNVTISSAIQYTEHHFTIPSTPSCTKYVFWSKHVLRAE